MTRRPTLLIGLAFLIFLATTLYGFGQAQEAVLYSFKYSLPGADGMNPAGGVIFDQEGNLYGTTQNGGLYAQGVVFELSPSSSGGWTESILHDFGGTRSDGSLPVGTLTIDAKGNLYGVTEYGGDASGGYGGGTVYEVSPNPDGTWTETVLYALEDCNTGCYPMAGVILDASGNLYGTTTANSSPECNDGGIGYGCGSVFELTSKSGSWSETILYSFKGGTTDGFYPQAALVLDSDGNLYGTTAEGGDSGVNCTFDGYFGCGVVFELSHSASGWRESILHFFTGGKDGYYSSASLVFDAKNNLYGTTQLGGVGNCENGYGQFVGCGTVFQLVRAQGNWDEVVIHSFASNLAEVNPVAGLIVDSKGNLYGTTANYLGNVFELSPLASGKWHMTVLYAFDGSTDGLQPLAGVTAKGRHLYGTTFRGGEDAEGVVFEISP